LSEPVAQPASAIDALQQGGVIVYPTEAVFGLGCDPDDQAAVEKLLAIKQRPVEKGLILIADNYGQLLKYVDDAKIAALGLKFKAKGTYHGLSLNIDMDLSPFKGINPCGYANLAAIQTMNLNKKASFEALETRLIETLINQLSD